MKTRTFAWLTIESGVKSCQQIAGLISVVPDRQWRQGSCVPLTGVMRHTNGIRFDSRQGEHADINEHAFDIVSRFSKCDITALAEAREVSVEFHLAIYSDVEPVVNLRPDIIAALASIGSGLDIDTYVRGEEEKEI